MEEEGRRKIVFLNDDGYSNGNGERVEEEKREKKEEGIEGEEEEEEEE